MPPPAVLASDIMDTAAAYLNDTALTMFTYTAQLPYVKIANEKLEKELIVFDSSIQHKRSTAISVPANTKTLQLPADFLIPIRLFERAPGQNDSNWVPMDEGDWEPTSIPYSTNLNKWAFRDNNIQFVGCAIAREVLLDYERMLAVVIGNVSPTDSYLFKDWLGAKTAELCARYIGMNAAQANEIRDNELFTANDALTRMLTHNRQAFTFRRRKYTAQTG